MSNSISRKVAFLALGYAFLTRFDTVPLLLISDFNQVLTSSISRLSIYLTVNLSRRSSFEEEDSTFFNAKSMIVFMFWMIPSLLEYPDPPGLVSKIHKCWFGVIKKFMSLFSFPRYSAKQLDNRTPSVVRKFL